MLIIMQMAAHARSTIFRVNPLNSRHIFFSFPLTVKIKRG